MREILFRGRTTDCGWKIGTFISTYLEKMLCTDGEARIIPNLAGPPHCGIVTDFGEIYVVERETVGQFTGRYDKNGEKVYEGDVLSILGGEYRGVVMWSDHDQCYFISPNGDDHTTVGDFGDYGRADYYEVVGNVHDNPELLKKEE